MKVVTAAYKEALGLRLQHESPQAYEDHQSRRKLVGNLAMVPGAALGAYAGHKLSPRNMAGNALGTMLGLGVGAGVAQAGGKFLADIGQDTYRQHTEIRNSARNKLQRAAGMPFERNY